MLHLSKACYGRVPNKKYRIFLESVRFYRVRSHLHIRRVRQDRSLGLKFRWDSANNSFDPPEQIASPRLHVHLTLRGLRSVVGFALTGRVPKVTGPQLLAILRRLQIINGNNLKQPGFRLNHRFDGRAVPIHRYHDRTTLLN